MRQAEFRDPRLVEVYDAECTWGRDDDFFVYVVDMTSSAGARVLDLGCGTGRLALGLAAAGHTVTGVDPARASLDAARAKPGAGHVTWIEGTSSVLPAAAFDVVVMSSHVAQFVVTNDEWKRTLDDLKRALVPNGVLVFDGRDPVDQAWERWNPIESRRHITVAAGVVEVWTEVNAVSDNVVAFTRHYTFPDGDELQSTASLRFRTEVELRASLTQAGFTVEEIYGGWGREPVGAGDGELLVIARLSQSQ